ncbi:hypothetical protein HDV64DRAFT_244441 [Trichoderma sp. TUCIM 5745]
MTRCPWPPLCTYAVFQLEASQLQLTNSKMSATTRVGPRDGRLKSKGCLACIRMKVKCDEAKPHCLRCQRGHRDCPGYRDQQTAVFRYESGTDIPGTLSTSSRSASPAPLHPMSTDWLHVAIVHFFHNFVVAPDGPFPGFMELLPRLFGMNPDLSYLNRSVEAISMASLAKAKHMGDEYINRARTTYGLALRSLGSSLQQEKDSPSAAILATVDILWKYDLIMGEDNLASKSPHRQGQLEFLKTRLSKAKPKDDAKWLNRSVRAGVVMQRILLHPNENAAVTEVNFPIDTSTMETPPSALRERLLPWAASSGVQVSACLRNPTNVGALMACLQSLQDLQRALQEWEDKLPEEWRPTVIPNSQFQVNSSIYRPAYLTLFPNIVVSSLCTSYYVAKLSVLRSIAAINGLDTMAPISGLNLLDVQSSLVAVVDTICSTVPYNLGQIDSRGEEVVDGDTRCVKVLFLTRSLYLAAQVPGLPDLQVQWIQDTLEFIGHERGVGQALVVKQDLAVRRQLGILGLSHLS